MVENLSSQIQRIFCLEFKFANLENKTSNNRNSVSSNLKSELKNSMIIPQVITSINRQNSMPKPVIKRQSSAILPFQCVANAIRPEIPIQHQRISSNLSNSIVYEKPIRSSQM